MGHLDYRARPLARDDPTGPRRAGSMVVVGVLRIHPSEFLLEDSGSEFTSSLLKDTTSRSSSVTASAPDRDVAPTQPRGRTMSLTLRGLG